MKLEFERDTSIEDKNRFHRYYQVIKYDLGNRYIPKFNEQIGRAKQECFTHKFNGSLKPRKNVKCD